jgi:hypothetical protein
MSLLRTLCHAIAYAAVAVVILLFVPRAADAASVQNDYRLYANTDGATPDDPWPVGGTNLGENSGATGANALKSGDILRIRMNVSAVDSAVSGNAFKLQYKQGAPCSGGGTWSDVGAVGSGTIWRAVDNGAVSDGSTLPSTLLTVSDVVETYEENNPSATMPNAINIGQDGEWDWVVQHNGAAQGATYCFRMVLSGGTLLDGYNDYPTVETRTFTPKSQNWRLYNDETNETPTNAMAAENAQPIGVRKQNPLKLRVSIAETGGEQGTDRKFKIQFSTVSDFSSGVTDLTEIGSCGDSSLWCYADGVDTNDVAISTRVLTDSAQSGVHNESGIGTSTFDHSANTVAEHEFTMQSRNGVADNQVYYFRAYDVTGSAAVPLNTGETYPNVKTFATALSFTVQGVASGTTIDGVQTNVTTTATTVPFGILSPNVRRIGAQRLTVTQDGGGYTLYVKSDGPLRTAGADSIPSVSGTNAAPSAWGYVVSQQTTGIFGYHPDDNVLSASSTRFQANDTWAALDTTFREIVNTIGPLENDVHDILFSAETSAIQPAGSYTNLIMYVVVPAY